MGKKRKQPNRPKPFTQTKNESMAKLSMRPEYQNGFTLSEILPKIEDAESGITWTADTNSVIEALKEQTKKLRNNDLSTAEKMLLSQSLLLDAVFNKYTLSAIQAKNPEQFKAFFDIALKAQRQCRANLETLALIKNPQPYVRQQNVAQQQIVNNAAPVPQIANAHAHGENSKMTNELLEDKRHEHQRLDIEAPQTAGENDKVLDAVAAIHRSENT